MFRHRLLSALVLAAIPFSPVVAQQAPLALVPVKSALIVQIHGWERTVGRLNAALKAAAPDYAPLISGEIENGIAQALMGRELKGLAKDGPVLLVFPEFPTAGEDVPEFSVVAKVDNYVQFRDAILKDDERKDLKAKDGYETTKIDDHQVYFLNKGDYVVVTPSEANLKMLVDKKFDSLAGKLDKAIETKLMSADVSVYVDMATVNKKFADQITMAKAVIDQITQALEGQGSLEKAQIEMMKKIYAGMIQLVEDSEHFVAALELPPEGFLLRLHTQVGAKSKTNEWISGVKSTPLAELGRLPAGVMAYSGGMLGQDLMKGGLMMMGAPGGAGGAKEDKAVVEAAKELEELKTDGWAAAANVPASGLQEIKYKEPTRAVATMLKMYQAVPADSSFMGMAIKGKLEVATDAQRFKSFTLHSASYTIDFDKIIESVPEQTREMTKKMLEKMVAPKQHIWFGTDGKAVVQVTAADWNAAQEMLAKFVDQKSTLASESSFAAAVKRLPARSSMQALVDAGRYAQVMIDAMGDTLKMLGGNAEGKVKPAEGPPEYIGFAVELHSPSAGLDLWVPAKAVHTIISMVKPMLGGLGN